MPFCCLINLTEICHNVVVVGLERFSAELNLQSHTVLINFTGKTTTKAARGIFILIWRKIIWVLKAEFFYCEEDKLKIWRARAPVLKLAGIQLNIWTCDAEMNNKGERKEGCRDVDEPREILIWSHLTIFFYKIYLPLTLISFRPQSLYFIIKARL